MAPTERVAEPPCGGSSRRVIRSRHGYAVIYDWAKSSQMRRAAA